MLINHEHTDRYALMHGDSLEGMTHAEGLADLIVTDPPYSTISGGTGTGDGRPSGMLSKNDGKIFKHNDIQPFHYMKLMYDVLRPGCQAYVFTNTKNMEVMLMEARKAGFGLHNIIVWEKNNVTPNRWYMKKLEYILLLYKSPAKMIRNPSASNIFKFNNVKSPKLHPTEKPVDLLSVMIENSSNFGDTVFDPFMGAGSTGIAALSLGRKFIGIDIDEEYYKISVDRIKAM